MSQPTKNRLTDVIGATIVGIQASPLGDKIWVCVDGECRFRVSRIMETVDITDMRKGLQDEQQA